MMKEITIMLVVVMVCFVAGCETAKGAKEGFKKDWSQWQEFDEKLQEKLW